MGNTTSIRKYNFEQMQSVSNTIIINNAQSYGLSDLHQMRGRVGRSNKKAFCYQDINQII